MDMLLSIIVPLYNTELYIENCLLSLLDQGFDTNTYEIIIVNDGSTDKSLEIINKYKNKYDNIKILNQKNAGLSAARNTGIRGASGDYICFVDSDDFLVRNQLFNLVELAKLKNVEILTYGILSGKYDEVLDKSKNVKTLIDKTQKIQTGIEYIAEHNYNNGVWYYLIKRDFLLKTNILFEVGRKCEDGMFTMNLFLNSHSMLHINTPVYCYIRRENSIVTKKDIGHQRVMIDDFLYAIFYLTNIILQYKENMNAKCYQRCLCRRDSYIFFLLIRIIEAGISRKEKNIILYRLKNTGLYPIKSLDLDYSGKQIQLLTWILNHSVLYSILCFIYRTFKK